MICTVSLANPLLTPVLIVLGVGSHSSGIVHKDILLHPFQRFIQYFVSLAGDEGIEPCWCSLTSCSLTGAWLRGWWREEFIEFAVFSFQELSLFSSARRSSVSV